MPWLLLFGCVRLAAAKIATLRLINLAAATFLIVGCWVYYDAIFLHPDAQGGLIFMVVPAIASALFMLFILVLAITRIQTNASLSQHRDA
jgi:hypothetical protein